MLKIFAFLLALTPSIASAQQQPQEQPLQLPDDIRVCQTTSEYAEAQLGNSVKGWHKSAAQAAILLQENAQYKKVNEDLRKQVDALNAQIAKSQSDEKAKP